MLTCHPGSQNTTCGCPPPVACHVTPGHCCPQASLSNIPPKSALLVVHVISVWVMSLFTWWVSEFSPDCRPRQQGLSQKHGAPLRGFPLATAFRYRFRRACLFSWRCMRSFHHKPCRLWSQRFRASLSASQLLWTYAKKSVALRVRYFTTLPKGVASHTALVQDIPGVPFGTQVQRVESVAPKFIASKARH